MDFIVKFIFGLFAILSTSMCFADLPITNQHNITINHKKISYNATVGVIPITQQGQVIATMSYIAYNVIQPTAAKPRPITFISSGGPGESSLDLNILNAGPKVLISNIDSHNYQMIDNPNTWLPFTDEVFIDITGSGLGRIVSEKDKQYLYSVKGDNDAFSQFIKKYLEQYNRADSKIYLAGESYAGFRSAYVANICQTQYHLKISGMVLLSPMLNVALVNPKLASTAELAIPTYYLVAGYNDHLRTLETLLANAKKMNKPLTRSEFADNLMGDGEKLSLLDGRFIVDTDISKIKPTADGIININLVMSPHFILLPAIQSYLHEDLNIPTDQTYIDAVKLHHHWTWNKDIGTNALPTLQNDLQTNLELSLLVFAGYYDAIVPYKATHAAINSLSVDDQTRIRVVDVASGHKLYIDPKARDDMFRCIQSFYNPDEKTNICYSPASLTFNSLKFVDTI